MQQTENRNKELDQGEQRSDKQEWKAPELKVYDTAAGTQNAFAPGDDGTLSS